MKLNYKINLNTVIDYEVLDDFVGCAAGVRNEYCYVNDNFRAVENGELDEYEFERFNKALLALAEAGTVRATTVAAVLSCFTEAEQTAIIEKINSDIEDGCEIDSSSLYSIRYDTCWYERSQMREAFDEDDPEYTRWDYVLDEYLIFDEEGHWEDDKFVIDRVFACGC